MVMETVPRSIDPMLPDPEEDALDALKTIKSFIQHDLNSTHDSLIAEWQNLDEYLLELCSQSLEHLSREPTSLAAQEERFRSQLEDVSCGNYRALIEGFECAGAVRDGVTRVRSRLDGLVRTLPDLAAATREFSKNVATVQRARERQLRTATEAGRVLDLLDLPALMRALVHGQLYDEALELREHSQKLRMLHSKQPLVLSVCEHIDTLTHQMVAQLLVALRDSIQLPTCLRIVGFLRRLDVFPELRLRMLFLHCRGEWMRNCIQQSRANGTSQARLVALSDGTRAMLFEIITQYKAVFSDDDDPSDKLSQCPHNEHFSSNSANTALILHNWTSTCIAEYLSQLGSGLRAICDGAALNTVLQQAMYCGHSLGRVGADFRAALAPLFDAAVMRIYASHLAAARTQFETMIEDHRWAPVGSSAFRANRSASAGSSESREKPNGTKRYEDDEGDTTQYNPPLAVLDSPPLAVFLNGILVALNELRLCAPVSLGPRLGIMLEETVLEAGRFMSAIGGPGGVFLKRADRPHFAAMISLLRDLCVPHAARCLDFCMGQTNLTRVSFVTESLMEIFGDAVPLPIRMTTTKQPSEQANGSPTNTPKSIATTKTETRDLVEKRVQFEDPVSSDQLDPMPNTNSKDPEQEADENVSEILEDQEAFEEKTGQIII